MLHVTHAQKTRIQYSKLFFISESERNLHSEAEMREILWMSPTVHVSREALFAAIEIVELLGEWLQERTFTAKYPNARP